MAESLRVSSDVCEIVYVHVQRWCAGRKRLLSVGRLAFACLCGPAESVHVLRQVGVLVVAVGCVARMLDVQYRQPLGPLYSIGGAVLDGEA